jgi:hypothetical protein
MVHAANERISSVPCLEDDPPIKVRIDKDLELVLTPKLCCVCLTNGRWTQRNEYTPLYPQGYIWLGR